MSPGSGELEALLTLLGDESDEIAATARQKLLEAGHKVVGPIKEKIQGRPLEVRVRAKQIIYWLETESRSWELPAYVPGYENSSYTGRDDYS